MKKAEEFENEYNEELDEKLDEDLMEDLDGDFSAGEDLPENSDEEEISSDKVVLGDNLASAKKVREYDKVEFGALEKELGGQMFSQDIFGNIPVDVNVVLGKSKVSLDKILQLSKGDIVEIEKNIGENVDLLINGQLIAQGEIVAVGENYGVKVNKVIAR